jgi:Caspase domain
VALARQVADKLNGLASSPKDVRFVFYFAGHGYSSVGDDLNFMVFRDASMLDRKALGVADLLINLGTFMPPRKMHPFLLIDACRNEVFQTEQLAAAKTVAKAMNSSPGYFISYAVAKGNTARDDDNRFMTFLKPELKEHGMSINSICEAARDEATLSRQLWVGDGPQCTGDSSQIASNQFFRLPSDELCESAFSSIWQLMDRRRDVLPRRKFMERLAFADPAACEIWSREVRTHSQQCPAALQQRFSPHFSSCSAAVQVSTLEAPVPDPIEVIGQTRIAQAGAPVADIDGVLTRVTTSIPDIETASPRRQFRAAKSTEAVKPAWTDVVVANKNVG